MPILLAHKEKLKGTAPCSLLFTFIFLQIGCAGTLKLPSSDSTPPTASLRVKVSSLNAVVSQGGPPLSYHFSAFPVELTGHGYDGDGGVKKVSVHGSRTWTCVDPSTRLVQRADALISYDSPLTFSAKPGDGVLKEQYVPVEITINDFNCQGSYVLSGLSIEVVATAENFYDGKATTPLLTLAAP